MSVVAVTGAASGIGAASARLFAGEPDPFEFQPKTLTTRRPKAPGG